VIYVIIYITLIICILIDDCAYDVYCKYNVSYRDKQNALCQSFGLAGLL
jgi:hypothetical protein